MHVEEADLADDGGADEIVAGVYLRADFEAEAAGHAAGERVALFLNFGGDAWAFAEAVGAVDGDPGFYALEESNMNWRLPASSRTVGKFVIGLTVMGGVRRSHRRRRAI